MTPSEAIEVLQAEREGFALKRSAYPEDSVGWDYWQTRIDAADMAIKALEPHIRDELIQDAAARASDLLKGV